MSFVKNLFHKLETTDVPDDELVEDEDASEEADTETESSDTGVVTSATSSDFDNVGNVDADCSAISNFFGYWRLKKDADSNPNGSPKEKKNKGKVTSNTDTPSQPSDSKDMCKNNSTQKIESALPGGIHNVTEKSRLRENVKYAPVKTSSDDVTAKTEKNVTVVKALTDSILSNSLKSNIQNLCNNIKPSIVEVSQKSDSDSKMQAPSATPTSYANVLKTETARPMRPAVKPCGHGTLAIFPKIPSRASKIGTTLSAPSSPEISTKAKYKTSIANGRRFSLNTSSSTSLTLPCEKQVETSKHRTNQPVNDTVRAAIKLQVDLPKSSQEAIVNKSISSDNTNILLNGKQDEDDALKKNLINQEAKFQSQLNDLSKQLSTRDAEANKLRFEMEELQRDVFAKSAGIDRLQAELQSAHKEFDAVRQKLKHVEDEYQNVKHRNGELSEQIAQKTENFQNFQSNATARIAELQSTIRGLKAKVESLEIQIEVLEREKKDIEKQKESITQQREEEKKKFDTVLDEALQEKSKIDNKWEIDFEKMRTVNIVKEQQLLDDFEWKLREIEKNCKIRLQEKDKKIEEKLTAAYEDAEKKMKQAEQIIHQVERLKTYEEEVSHLRGLTSDQQQSIANLKQQQEEMKTTEQCLRNETKKLRTLIDIEKENLQYIQRLHSHEMLDRERKLQVKLNEQKSTIGFYWEERLLHECGRLKEELEQLHNEDKTVAIENLKSQKEEEFIEAKEAWERKIQACSKEILLLKKSLQDKDVFFHTEMEKVQTNTDREIMELRRLMNKIDMMHHEKFESLVQEHDQELDKINEEHEKKLRDLESHSQLQLSSMRTTLELVKVQMENESQEKIQSLIAQHRAELDSQWANLIHQKSEAIRLVEEEYVNKYKILEEQFYTQQKSHESREVELLKTIDSLKNEINSKDSTLDDLQNNVDTLEGGIQVLHQEIAGQGENLLKTKIDADHRIRGLQESLVKLQTQQKRERDEHHAQILKLQKQSQGSMDLLQRKCQCLTKLFEEVRARYERRESRQEDISIISDLRHVIAEQEKDLTCLNEDKRYFQMKLMNLERLLEKRGIRADDLVNEQDDTDTNSSEEESASIPCSFVPPHDALPSQINGPTSSFNIPPTIPECEDCED